MQINRAVSLHLLSITLVTLCLAGFAPTVLSADPDDAKESEHHHEVGEAEHSAHQSSQATRSEVSIAIPEVNVIRQDGKKLPLRGELDDGRPVILNFVYASCTTVCPALSHVFSKVQSKLGDEVSKVHLVSISIDPENDTPAKLRAYAKKFKAGPHWNHYTGTQEVGVQIQNAFGVHRGDKMNHTPVTFLRSSPGKSWLRIDGFVSPDTLIHDFHNLPK